MTVCTEITGTSREPILALDAALLRSGAADGRRVHTDDVDIGRGTVRLRFPDVSDGRYDLALRLTVDGRTVPQRRLLIPSLRIKAGTPAAACD
ncbi:MAG: hypothetical protein GEV08_23000 [Acidimicrobiia bacterium]|nr:hypothetical protein [Actinophytocola sp.]MPY95816.1 hypothetical protein [Acidimicrobiia bacterium]